MRKTKLALLLMAALLVGVCIGFFANDAIIRARIRHYSRIPANLPEHITQRLTVRLKLDEEQQRQIREVIYSYDGRMQEVREQSDAMLDGVFVSMRDDIARHLKPEQAEEYRKIAEERRQRLKERRQLLQAFPPSPPPESKNAGK